jgi:MFS transporter, ACS family, aldohexuronate transporter
LGNQSDNPYEVSDSPGGPSVSALGPSSGDGGRRSKRVWIICGLLLLASAINYLDRQTLANASPRIKAELNLSNEQYGGLEAWFGYGFVVGSIIFGVLVDRFSVRWVYPVVLASWSAVTVATGFSENYSEFLYLRFLLGVFEAGHWPCGIRVVRALTDFRGRTMGNGLLQSGTSIGAIAAPLIMLALLTDQVGSWRPAFQIVGAVGGIWVIAWLATVRRSDFPPLPRIVQNTAGSWDFLLKRRMWIVFIVVALINTAWQLFRAWLVLFLQEGRGYSEQQTLLFTSGWYAATDVGCLSVGALVLVLTRRGMTVHKARLLMFAGCSLMCMTLLALPWMPRGWLLLTAMLISGAGALGVFPLYHAYTQDISARHQGKVTGFAGVAAWALVPPAQELFGRLVDESHSYDHGLMAAALLPAAATVILWLFWGNEESNDAAEMSD